MRELTGAHNALDDRALLDAMDYGDLSGVNDGDLRELCLMSLQDREPEDAALLVLQLHLNDRLRPGQLQNLAHKMADEKVWEQYPDMALHEDLFVVASVLYQAFPKVFPTPDAVRAEVEVTATTDEGRALLQSPLPEPFVIRLLADGMPQGLLHRLFDDQLEGARFPEAEGIAWTVQQTAADGGGVRLEVISSARWLAPLRHSDAWTSRAFADPPPTDDDDDD